MSAVLVRAGQFSFRYRGYLLPVAVLLLFIPSPRITTDPAVAGAVGLLISLLGQIVRIGNIGLAYIIRGGKDHQVYAEALVTSGLYSHCRNPMYVGNFFLAVGLGAASNSWVFFIAGLAISLFMHRAIVAAEEDFLRRKFGVQYEAYCARVSRWFPRLAGLVQTIRGMQFDWRRVLLKEYASVFDYFSATALLAFINLTREEAIDEHWLLASACLAIIIGRLILSQLSRRATKLQTIAQT